MIHPFGLYIDSLIKVVVTVTISDDSRSEKHDALYLPTAPDESAVPSLGENNTSTIRLTDLY